jgi:D-alanyl-D-alanine carboxypeptidase
LKNSALFNSIAKKSSYYITSEKEKLIVPNTNKLLHAKILGKTGNGKNAGFCFAGYQL